MAVRSLAPKVIVADEIGNKEDAEIINYAICSGVKGIFTAHGNNIQDLRYNPEISKLIKEFLKKLFSLIQKKEDI